MQEIGTLKKQNRPLAKVPFARGLITKIVRRGFHLGEKILRPTEVITSKPE